MIEALGLSKQEGAFKDLGEGSDGRAPSGGNKSCRRFKTECFNLSNAAAVAAAYTDDAAAAVVATGLILFLEAGPFTLDFWCRNVRKILFNDKNER